MDQLHEILNVLVDAAILLFEFVGVVVIIISGVKGIYGYFRRDPLTRLNLAKGMAMGLEFKLGSEILRTVIVREFSEIFIVAGIILLRATLTFLIHWEIKTKRRRKTSANTSKKRAGIPLKPKKKNRLKQAAKNKLGKGN